jgi:DNA-binding NarL/FixJ family response regulator
MNKLDTEERGRLILDQIAVLKKAVESVAAGLNSLEAQLTEVEPTNTLAGIDPRDPRNKQPNGKLTERGIEICYRMFDAGKSRYAVATAMSISFSAAEHRIARWHQLGGAQRSPQSLDL